MTKAPPRYVNWMSNALEDPACWKTHVPRHIRGMWHTFTGEQRQALFQWAYDATKPKAALPPAARPAPNRHHGAVKTATASKLAAAAGRANPEARVVVHAGGKFYPAERTRIWKGKGYRFKDPLLNALVILEISEDGVPAINAHARDCQRARQKGRAA